MFKKIAPVVFATAMLATPLIVAAQTTSTASESALIAQLTQLVQTLEQEVQALVAAGSSAASSGTQSNTSGTAAFSASPQTGTAPLTVTFNSSASTANTTVEYGDGSEGTLGSYTYQTPGTYTAKLLQCSWSEDCANAAVLGTVTITVTSGSSAASQQCPSGTTGTYPFCTLSNSLFNIDTGTPVNSSVVGSSACPQGDVNIGNACMPLSSTGQVPGSGTIIPPTSSGQTTTGDGTSKNGSTSGGDVTPYQMTINSCGNSHSYGKYPNCQECPNGEMATPDGSSCVATCPAGSVGTPPNCTNECDLPAPICPSGFVNTGGICGQLCDRTGGYIIGNPQLIAATFYGPAPLDVSLYDDGAYGTVTINFGDGTAPYSTAVTCNGTCSFPAVTHFYKTPGTYTATLTGEQTQGSPVVLIGTASIYVFDPANPSTCPAGTQGIYPICYGGSPKAPSLQLDLSQSTTSGAPTLSFTINGQSNVTLTPGTPFSAQYTSSNAIGCAATTLIGSTTYPVGGIVANTIGTITGAAPTTGGESYTITCTGGSGAPVSATVTVNENNTSMAGMQQLANALTALESALSSLF